MTSETHRGLSAGWMGSALPQRVREEIARFDPEVSGMSVAEFCRRHQVSRASFYRVQDRARREGLAAALVPGSRAPKKPATKYGAFTVEVVKAVHRELLGQFKEAGPWSVEWRLFQLGIEPLPSRSTIARIMRSQGLSKPSPRKRPRSSYQRFRRACGNELWQLDAIEWRLPDGLLVTVYQLIDDHSRACPALIARPGGESVAGATQVLQTGFAALGMPQAVLSDNSAAFNQHRRGKLSATEIWLASMGIRPISGRIAHPQTQGKVERAHQSPLRWLEGHQPTTLDELQQLLDRFWDWYNHERQHQGLGHHLTPMAVWQAATKLGPEPRPIPLSLLYDQPLRQPGPPAKDERIGHRRIAGNLKISWKGRNIQFGTDMAGQTIHLIEDTHVLEVFDDNGELHAVIPWPPPAAQRHVSATRPPIRIAPVIDRRKRPRTNDSDLSQMS